VPPKLVVQAPADRLRRLRELQQQFLESEKIRLRNLDVFALIGYEPSERQAEFHAATEFDVLYGGAAGGGKSVALVAEGLRDCARYPGLRTLLVRRTYDELEESIFPALRKFDYGRAVGAKWNGTSRELQFTNGSLFRFRYMETLAHATRRQGGEYQLLLVDELTLMVPGVVDLLRYDRMRASTDVPVIGVRCTSNPGGPGHGQVKTRYIDATGHGQRIVTDDNGLTIRFIHARSTDNPHLDPGYQSRLDSIPDPARRAAMRDGDWDQFAGQMFKEFRRAAHVVDPVEIPLSWRRYNGIDWGFAAPWAVLWGAVDEDGRVWIYREIYKTQVGEADQARMILAAEGDGERVLTRWADDAMWASRGDAKPISDIYAENGVHLTQAGSNGGSRIAGWQRWHSYLADGPACPLHRARGMGTCPMLHIFSTCENLLSELTTLPYSATGNPEDSDPNAIDHAMDAGRYLLTNLGTGPEFVILGDTAPSHMDGIKLMRPAGAIAVEPDPDSPWPEDGDGTPRARVQQSPFT
jgi:hypothetical protein